VLKFKRKFRRLKVKDNHRYTDPTKCTQVDRHISCINLYALRHASPRVSHLQGDSCQKGILVVVTYDMQV